MGGFQVTYIFTGVSLVLLFSPFFFLCFVSSSRSLSCKLERKFHLNEMHKPGDVVLGGLFEVHYTSVYPERTFTSEPQQPHCTG